MIFARRRPSRTIMGHPPTTTHVSTTGQRIDWGVNFGMVDETIFVSHTSHPDGLPCASRSRRVAVTTVAPSARQSTHVTERILGAMVRPLQMVAQKKNLSMVEGAVFVSFIMMPSRMIFAAPQPSRTIMGHPPTTNPCPPRCTNQLVCNLVCLKGLFLSFLK
jgi:hypothetical protein